MCFRLKSAGRGKLACTWSKQPPAVMLMCGALAIVAEAVNLIVARFAVHLKAIFRTVPRQAAAVFRKITVAG